MARCAYDGADEGACFKAPEEDVCCEDGMSVSLVFCVGRVGPQV